MVKWYDENTTNKATIISSRIRIARNLKKYPFSVKIDNEDSAQLLKDVRDSIINDRCYLSDEFEYIDMNKKSELEKLLLFENHAISQNFLQSGKEKGVLLRNDEKVSIMINEEDHIRIQSIRLGDNLDEAYELADKLDDLIEESLEYAFSKDYGYLTTCPTNIGTGLRASYMIHIPMLSNSQQFGILINSIGKFGMTMRGIFGEGTQPMGHIFQISNQVTVGKNEKEILLNLKNITKQVLEHEDNLRAKALKDDKVFWEDKVKRAFGILKFAQKMSTQEAMELLSFLKLGVSMGILEEEDVKNNIYNIMMNIRSANLQIRENKELNEEERDILRATYLRNVLK